MIRRPLALLPLLLVVCSNAPEEDDDALQCPASLGFPMGAGGSKPSEQSEEERDAHTLTITRIRGLYERRLNSGHVLYQQEDAYKGIDDFGRVYSDHDVQGGWKNGASSLEVTVRVPRRNWHQRSKRRVQCVLEHSTGSEPFREDVKVQGTEIVDDKSTCTLEFPSRGTGGDSLRVRVDLLSGSREQTTTRTRVMTLWKRVRVEYKRMAGAHRLPVDAVADSFAPAFVQFDFSPEEILTGEKNINYFDVPDDEFDVSNEQSKYFKKHFNHIHDPGWLCLLAAQHETLESSLAASTFDERQDMREIEASLNADGSEITAAKEEWLDGAKFIEITWDAEHAAGDSPTAKLYFEVDEELESVDSTKVTYQLKPHDITPLFLAQDSSGRFGTTQWAYSSKRKYFLNNSRELPDRIHSHRSGYAPMDGKRRIRLTNKFATSGFTMTVVDKGKRYFTSRIIILTHNRAFSDRVDGQVVPREGSSELLKTTVVHELTHALGFPHKCGYWDWTLLGERSCCMNYFNHGLLDDAGVLLEAEGAGKRDALLCTRHTDEIRKARLSEHRGLQWQWRRENKE